MGKISYGHHIVMSGLHEVCLDTVTQHAKRLPKSKVTHNVKTVEIEPFGHIHWFAQVGLDLCQELISVCLDTRLVVAKSCTRT